MKHHAGYLPATLTADAFSDPEFLAVLAVIALHRAKKIQPEDVQDVLNKFEDVAPFSTLRLELGEPEETDDAGPPESSSNGNEPSSGDGSPTSSETSMPPTSGIPGSVSSVSGQVTSST